MLPMDLKQEETIRVRFGRCRHRFIFLEEQFVHRNFSKKLPAGSVETRHPRHGYEGEEDFGIHTYSSYITWNIIVCK